MRVHHQATCLHCRRYSTIDARGLCCSCYHQREIRDIYPSSRRYPADRKPAQRPQYRFPYSGEAICIDPGPQRGRPSNQDDGHDERMAAHSERVAREDSVLCGRPEENPEDLDTRRAAELLGIATVTMTQWIRDGKVRARRVPVGRRFAYRIRRADLANLLRDRAADMVLKEVFP